MAQVDEPELISLIGEKLSLQNDAMKKVLMTVCQRMVELENQIQAVKEAAEAERQELEARLQQKVDQQQQDTENKINETRKEIEAVEEARVENHTQMEAISKRLDQETQDRIRKIVGLEESFKVEMEKSAAVLRQEHLDDMSKMESVIEEMKEMPPEEPPEPEPTNLIEIPARQPQLKLGQHMDRQDQLSRSHKKEYESDLLTFSVPRSLRRKLEADILALNVPKRKKDPTKLLGACKMAQAYTRAKISSRIQEHCGYVYADTLERRQIDAEHAIQLLFQLLCASNELALETLLIQPIASEETSNSADTTDNVLGDKGESAQEIISLREGMRETIQESEFYGNNLEANDQVVEKGDESESKQEVVVKTQELIEDGLMIPNNELPVLKTTLVELAAIVEELRDMSGKAMTEISPRLDKLSLSIEKSHMAINANRIDINRIAKDIPELARLVANISNSMKRDTSSQMIKAYVRDNTMRTDKHIESLEGRLNMCTEELRKEIEKVIKSQRKDTLHRKQSTGPGLVQVGSKDHRFETGSEEYNALISSLKYQLTYDFGLNKSRSDIKELDAEVHRLRDQVNMVRNESISAKSIKSLERKIAMKADRQYVDHLVDDIKHPRQRQKPVDVQDLTIIGDQEFSRRDTKSTKPDPDALRKKGSTSKIRAASEEVVFPQTGSTLRRRPSTTAAVEPMKYPSSRNLRIDLPQVRKSSKYALSSVGSSSTLNERETKAARPSPEKQQPHTSQEGHDAIDAQVND